MRKMEMLRPGRYRTKRRMRSPSAVRADGPGDDVTAHREWSAGGEVGKIRVHPAADAADACVARRAIAADDECGDAFGRLHEMEAHDSGHTVQELLQLRSA